MDVMWAPWRAGYVERTVTARKKGCTFCRILKDNKDAERYIFLRTPKSFAVLNIYPFNGGHSLVIPKRHVAGLEQLTAAERVDLMDTIIKVQGLMTKAFQPQAFNVGLNLGHLAGAGIPEHLHVHVVPRWSGDVNFMPALFDTKIIPVSLEDCYQRLTGSKGRGSRANKNSDRKERT